MALARSGEEGVMTRLVGKGSRRGSTWFGRAGDFIQQPPVWAGLAAALSMAGPRGRRAALRGSVCYSAAALAHLPVKAMVGRSHPRGAAARHVGPVTSSFPSGHAASDLAFVMGASRRSRCCSSRSRAPPSPLTGRSSASGVTIQARCWWAGRSASPWPPRRGSCGRRGAVRTTRRRARSARRRWLRGMG